MIIEEPDFKLTLSASGTSWDLELLRGVKSRDGSVRYEFKLEGYGIPMDKCMQIIINYRLERNKETYSLKEYIRDYKEQIKQLKELLK